MQIELAIAQSSLEESERREELVSSMLENINEHEDSTSRRYRMEVMREFSDAKINYERFRAQIETSRVQLKRIEAQRERLEKTATKLERIFNEGHATAPERGLVSETLAYPGQTVKPGEPIAEIYDISERYLEWALPPNGLRHPEPGDPVYVVHGSRVFEGEVVDLVPMSVNRSDVDTIFAKNVVGQLVKVRPKNTQDLPPLLSHCDVRYNYWRSLDGIVRLFVGTMVAVGIWEQP